MSINCTTVVLSMSVFTGKHRRSVPQVTTGDQPRITCNVKLVKIAHTYNTYWHKSMASLIDQDIENWM